MTLTLAATRSSGASLSAWANASLDGMMATAVGWIAAWVALSLLLVVAWIVLVSVCHRLLAWRNAAAAHGDAAAARTRPGLALDLDQPPHDEFSKQLAGLGKKVRGQAEATIETPEQAGPPQSKRR